jgi:CubicO group peptidase (beta-lactamase class C family)
MRIKTLSHWLCVLAASTMLASASASQDVGSGPYTVLKDSAGLSSLSLGDAIEPLFDPGDGPDIGETRAVIVMRAGEVVAERYAEDFGPESRFHSWSIARTVTGLIAGMMVSDGLLALDDPAPVAAWRQTGDPRSAITLRHLLQMRSGLQHREDWQPGEPSDTLAMLAGEGAADQAAFAAAKPLVQRPGETFSPSAGSSMILAGIMTDRLTADRKPAARRDAMARFLSARFSGPLGLKDFVPEFDASGTLHGAMLMHMTARDYATIGEFIRRRGHVDGRQLIADPWFDFMTAPSPANAAFGGHLWLNRAGDPSPIFPGQASTRIMAAVGERGQFVLISPEQKLVVVRLGVTREDDMDALREALAKLVRRFPG